MNGWGQGMAHGPARHLSRWARLSRRAQLVALGIVVVVVGLGGAFAFRQFAPPSMVTVTRGQFTPSSMADLTRDTCASVKPAGPEANWETVLSTDTDTIVSMMSYRRLATGSRMGVLDTPVLVHPIAMQTHYDGNDCPHWMASTHVANGHHMELYDFVYDYPHQRMRLSSVGFPQEGSPVYANGFPAVPLSTAEALLWAQRHVRASSAWTPELVFFGLQDGWSTTGPPYPPGTRSWNKGGTDPTDPMWLILGSDGWPYLVSTSQQVYAINDLPIDR